MATTLLRAWTMALVASASILITPLTLLSSSTPLVVPATTLMTIALLSQPVQPAFLAGAALRIAPGLVRGLGGLEKATKGIKGIRAMNNMNKFSGLTRGNSEQFMGRHGNLQNQHSWMNSYRNPDHSMEGLQNQRQLQPMRPSWQQNPFWQNQNQNPWQQQESWQDQRLPSNGMHRGTLAGTMAAVGSHWSTQQPWQGQGNIQVMGDANSFHEPNQSSTDQAMNEFFDENQSVAQSTTDPFAPAS